MGIGPVQASNYRPMQIDEPCCQGNKMQRGRGGGHGAGPLRDLNSQIKELEDLEESDSTEEYDELDVNQDGVVDSSELESAGYSSKSEFQSTAAFLALHELAGKSDVEVNEG